MQLISKDCIMTSESHNINQSMTGKDRLLSFFGSKHVNECAEVVYARRSDGISRLPCKTSCLGLRRTR